MRRVLGGAAVLAAVCVFVVVPDAGAAGTVTRTVAIGDAVDRERDLVGGVVMQKISIGEDATDADLLLPDGVVAGRYQTLAPNHPAHSAPRCWNGGTPEDFAELDAQVAAGIAAGINPARSELVLTYLSSCAVVPGETEDAAVFTLLPSIVALAIHTNPEAVQAQLTDQIRHAVGAWGIRRFIAWNEPDALNPLTPPQYLDYYDLLHAALSTVEGETGLDLQIGGPANNNYFTASNIYVPILLDHVIAEGLTIDAVVMHRYGNDDRQPSSVRTREQVSGLRSLIDARTAAAVAAGVPWPPRVHLNEWTWVAVASPANDDARTGLGAAYAAVQLAVMDELGVVANYFAAQDSKEPPGRCVEPCEASTPDMIGYGLLDRFDEKRPTYHVFEWFRSLGETALAVTPTDDVLDGLQTMGAVAGASADGRTVRVLLANHDPNGAGTVVDVTLDLGERREPVSWQTTQTQAEHLAGDEPVSANGLGMPALSLAPNTVTLVTLTFA